MGERPVDDASEVWPAAARRIRRTQLFDAELGARLRALRIAAGMSQAALGEVVGVSFQQMQKYEKGKDRISAGMLQAIAAQLGVHPGSFYDQVPLPTGSKTDVQMVLKFAGVIGQIRVLRVRKQLMALAKALAGDET